MTIDHAAMKRAAEEIVEVFEQSDQLSVCQAQILALARAYLASQDAVRVAKDALQAIVNDDTYNWALDRSVPSDALKDDWLRCKATLARIDALLAHAQRAPAPGEEGEAVS